MAYKKPIADKINKAKEIKNLLEQAQTILRQEFLYGSVGGDTVTKNCIFDYIDLGINSTESIIKKLKNDSYVVGKYVVIN